MKEVKLIITENNVNIGLDINVMNTDEYIISIAKPSGVTMSATAVNSLIKTTYDYAIGTVSNTSAIQAIIALNLGTVSYVNKVFPYKAN